MADPFTLTVGNHVLHRSLSTDSRLPIDFYEPLVDDLLQDERYIKWSAGYKSWQLHCYGSPGCGKSTFAARIVEELRQRYEDKSIPIAYIRITEHVRDDHAGFLEDFLFCCYKQVCTRPAHAYEKACRVGQALSERLKHIRAALYQQLTENDHSFLIFDGYDTLDVTTCLLIDHELARLSNLSLLVTRRNPSYRQPKNLDIGCDNCGRWGLKLYWECQICGRSGPQYCCVCKEADVPCTNQEHSLALSEPYDRIDLNISGSSSRESHSAVVGFIARELKAFPALNPAESKEALAASIAERCGGNLNLVKLWIDDLVSMDNPTITKTLRDRLPRSIVAFFDSEIDKLLQSNPVGRDLGMMAIAAVAGSKDRIGYGMKVIDLERLMRQEMHSSLHLSRRPTRSLEDILTAANGLLTLQPYEDYLHVVCFNSMFKFYVRENYNEYLYLAKLKLCLDENSDRSEPTELWNIAPSTTSPPTISDAFGSKDYVDARSSSQDSAYYSRASTVHMTQDSHAGQSQAIEPKGLFERTSTLSPQSSIVEEAVDESVDEPLDDSNETDPSVTLCTFCQEQILSNDPCFGNHHESSEAILESMSTRCMICMDLYQDLLVPKVESHQVYSLVLQHYRYQWSIRSTGQSRNTKTSLIVVFTSHPDSRGILKTTLSTKKFHILSEADVHVATEDTLASSTDPNKSGGGLQIREWMKVCAETHPDCNKHQKTNFVPTRLVDLEIGDANMVRVVDTKLNNVKGPYLTLSHSWGPPNFLQLKTENKNTLMGPGVEISKLTPNFQQAISVARFIGVQYIWIDSLCIMQGIGGDFQSEGQLMHKVYRYSHCNIAIADSEDSEGGLFRNRHSASILPVSVEADGTGKLERGTWRILSDNLWDKGLLATKIYTRGWVFQVPQDVKTLDAVSHVHPVPFLTRIERMLAPRILHFAASQIFWDCSTLSACEALPKGLPHALDAQASTDRHWRGRMQLSQSDSLLEYQQTLVGVNDDSVETFWRSALLNYTSCNLTNQGDKSIAIWSIAKLVRDTLGEQYGGGLWENKLEEQLAWHVRNLAPETLGRIPELQYRYPSWSWASIKGSIIANDRLPKARQYVVTDHDGSAITFESHYEDENKEPELKRVPMSLLGYVAQGKLFRNSNSHPLGLSLCGREQEESTGSFDVFLDEALPSALEIDSRPYSFIILSASDTSDTGSQIHLPSQQKVSRGSARPSIHSNTSSTVLTYGSSSTPITYSGIALLLMPAKEYKANQNVGFKTLLREVVVRSPDRSWPDPPYGQGKSLVDRTTDLRMLVTALHRAICYVKEKGGDERSLYRRIGAIEFRDLSERAWQDIIRDGRSKIWLD